jgi:hypothetical protein
VYCVQILINFKITKLEKEVRKQGRLEEVDYGGDDLHWTAETPNKNKKKKSSLYDGH